MEFKIEYKVQSVLQLMIPFILQSAVQSIVQSSMVLHSLMTSLDIWISAVVISSLSVVVSSRSVIYFWHCCNDGDINFLFIL